LKETKDETLSYLLAENWPETADTDHVPATRHAKPDRFLPSNGKWKMVNGKFLCFSIGTDWEIKSAIAGW
jgi:hypothetical protein